MTERAKRAAEELRRRGWSFDTCAGIECTKDCSRCGHGMSRGARFCEQCGEPVTASFTDDSLADIEAAIAAALKDTA